MLKKQNRLTSKYEFNKVRYLANKDGTKYSSPFFHLFYIDVIDYDGPTKFGIVVSNKFDKRAVVRNKSKRIFREVIKEHFDKIKSGYWVVVHPRKESQNKAYEEISSAFIKALQVSSITR